MIPVNTNKYVIIEIAIKGANIKNAIQENIYVVPTNISAKKIAFMKATREIVINIALRSLKKSLIILYIYVVKFINARNLVFFLD